MTGVLSELVGILVGGIQSLATSIAQGLGDMAKALFVDGAGTTQDPYKLSTFSAIVAVFAGISLAISLTTLVTRWIMSLSARN